MRWASNGIVQALRHAATTSGPKVRLGTKWPSITSHWMRSTPAFSSSRHSSPSRAKSAGSTDGTICTGAISVSPPGRGRDADATRGGGQSGSPRARSIVTAAAPCSSTSPGMTASQIASSCRTCSSERGSKTAVRTAST